MNILCIDFNYIFSPFIRLYADRISDKENPTVSWRILENNFGIESIVNYDSRLLLNLVKLIKKNMSAGECKLYVVDQHSEIVKFVEEYSNNHINKVEDEYDEISITNIDFFDDMNYSHSGKASITRFGKYDDKDWLAYLKLNNHIQHVQWVKSANSSIFKNTVELYDKIYNSIEDLCEDDSIEDICYDRIYIARSPLYVPYKYQHLIDMIVECFKEE